MGRKVSSCFFMTVPMFRRSNIFFPFAERKIFLLISQPVLDWESVSKTKLDLKDPY